MIRTDKEEEVMPGPEHDPGKRLSGRLRLGHELPAERDQHPSDPVAYDHEYDVHDGIDGEDLR